MNLLHKYKIFRLYTIMKSIKKTYAKIQYQDSCTSAMTFP